MNHSYLKEPPSILSHTMDWPAFVFTLSQCNGFSFTWPFPAAAVVLPCPVEDSPDSPLPRFPFCNGGRFEDAALGGGGGGAGTCLFGIAIEDCSGGGAGDRFSPVQHIQSILINNHSFNIPFDSRKLTRRQRHRHHCLTSSRTSTISITFPSRKDYEPSDQEKKQSGKDKATALTTFLFDEDEGKGPGADGLNIVEFGGVETFGGGAGDGIGNG
ncbi:hypothetical protein NC653_024516 [Populus alba x Populus x berolinensis]|uniref:Uncharacterized protein n=1 Tax=Populus alba x Populus x berolinensis TaxID=444605 RepID=A0AAD6Q6X8_9ROSI|nr:hypothetical protein NC653_024516 [Populus alba x Populus x berolinensis]